MGLREKALDFSDVNESNLALTPEDRKKEIPSSILPPTNEASPNFSKTEKVNNGKPKDVIEEKRSEIFLNIIELTKELSQVHTEKELFSTLLLALMAYVGVKNIAFFIKNERKFQLTDFKGFSNPIEKDISVQDPLLSEIFKEKGVLSAKENKQDIIQKFFPDSHYEAMVPILRYEELTGFILIDSKITNDDYSVYDIMYLKLFGEIFGLFYSAMKDRSKDLESFKVHKNKIQQQDALIDFINSSSSNTIESIVSFWTNNNPESGFVLFLDENSGILPVLSAGMNSESGEFHRIISELTWYHEIREAKKWMHYPEYRDDQYFYEIMNPDDWNQYQNLYVLPLIYENEYSGFILLFSEKIFSANELSFNEKFFNVLKNQYLLKESKKQFDRSFTHSRQNPFDALSSFIRKKTIDQNLYSIIFLQFINSSRLQKVLNQKEVQTMRSSIESTIQDSINPDMVSKICDNEFLYFSMNQSKKEAWVNVKRLQKELSMTYPDENFRPLLKATIYNFPEDGEFSLSNLLFGI